VLAGRNRDKAERAVAALQPRIAARLSALALDATRPDAEALARLAPAVVYNASGPFQAQDYALARAAVSIGAHYVDLADARAFVTGIAALDAEAKAAGVLVVSGASSVPALSSAVIDAHLGHFARLEKVTYGIVPANGFDPGVATTASILSYVGRPFITLRDGRPATVRGWQGISRHAFPGIGSRWLAPCDIPDLALFPQRYPTLRPGSAGAVFRAMGAVVAGARGCAASRRAPGRTAAQGQSLDEPAGVRRGRHVRRHGRDQPKWRSVTLRVASHRTRQPRPLRPTGPRDRADAQAARRRHAHAWRNAVHGPAEAR
jgi:Saccharopine dehydrogenase NADP binding domain